MILLNFESVVNLFWINRLQNLFLKFRNFLGRDASDLHHSSTCIEGSDSNGLPVFIFMIAQLLIGCGASPLFTLGTTYIDDHVKKDSASMYIGNETVFFYIGQSF